MWFTLCSYWATPSRELATWPGSKESTLDMHLVQKVAEYLPTYRVREGRAAAWTPRCRRHTSASLGTSSVLTAHQPAMKTVFQFPQFLAPASVILVFFLLNTKSFKGRYWELKSLVSYDDCAVLLESFKQPHTHKSQSYFPKRSILFLFERCGRM